MEISKIKNYKLIQTENQTKQYEVLKIFIKNYIKHITELRYQKAFEEEQNTMTVSILNLLKNMLLFGMYDTRKSLDHLLRELLNLLHGTCDVTTVEE